MQRIKGFDGLRALALTAVFLQHYTGLGRDYETGGYGVWLFFALSGFLIVRILVGERRRIEAGVQTVWAGLRTFFWRRTLRIFPIYYLALGFCTLLAALHLLGGFDWRGAPWHYAYLSNVYFGLVVGRWAGGFGHFWSLAIEEQFYLLAAPLLLFSPARWARGLCAATVLAALACDLWLRAEGASAMVLYTCSLTNFGALAFGGWVGLGLPGVAKAGRSSWPAALGVVGAIAMIAGFHQVGLYTPAVATLIGAAPFWVAVLMAGLTLAGVYLNQDSALVRLLEWRPIAGFGRISYGFYLYHQLLPHWMLHQAAAGLGLHWRTPELLEAAVSFIVALILARLSWALIERPLLAFKDRPPRLSDLRALVGRARGLAPEAG